MRESKSHHDYIAETKNIEGENKWSWSTYFFINIFYFELSGLKNLSQ